MTRLSLQDQSLYRAQLERELGSEVLDALNNPTVVEVLVNSDGRLRVDRLGESSIELLDARVDASMLLAAIHTVAHLNGEVVNDESCVLWGELPWDGTRVSAMVPPTVPAPCLSLRKHLSRRIDLDEYVTAGRMTPAQREALGAAVQDRKNVLVAGGTGCGKTTLLNALLAEVHKLWPNHRLFILEKVREIDCPCPDVVQPRVTRQLSAGDLLQAGLRMRPDRIVVGEVLGPEALVMLQAWNTGQSGGFCSIHANSATAALLRLERCAAMATGGYVPRAEVAEAVDCIVFLQRGPDGPEVREILHVEGLDEHGNYRLRANNTEERV